MRGSCGNPRQCSNTAAQVSSSCKIGEPHRQHTRHAMLDLIELVLQPLHRAQHRRLIECEASAMERGDHIGHRTPHRHHPHAIR